MSHPKWKITNEPHPPMPIDPAYVGVRCVICGLEYDDPAFTRGLHGAVSYHTDAKPHQPFCSAKCGLVHYTANLQK